MIRSAVAAGAFATLLLASPAHAQSSGPAPCGDPTGGEIVGVVFYPSGVDASTDGRRLSLIQGSTVLCTAESEDRNAFRFRGVPPGRYEVLFAQPGMMGTRVEVEVSLGVAAQLQIEAELVDVLVGCRRWMASCSDVLAVTPPPSLSGAARDEFLFWQAALALAGAAAGGTEPWVACLGAYPNEALRSALFVIHRDFAPAEECGVPVSGYGIATHTPTGRPARIVTMRVQGEGENRVLEFSNVQATRDRYAYVCPLTGVAGQVQLGRCVPV
jgi:hypothetical protein